MRRPRRNREHRLGRLVTELVFMGLVSFWAEEFRTTEAALPGPRKPRTYTTSGENRSVVNDFDNGGSIEVGDSGGSMEVGHQVPLRVNENTGRPCPERFVYRRGSKLGRAGKKVAGQLRNDPLNAQPTPRVIIMIALQVCGPAQPAANSVPQIIARALSGAAVTALACCTT